MTIFPLSLYLHIPYCVHKCPYCDFHSRVEVQVPQERYVDALLMELGMWRRRFSQDARPLQSIFLGGGTPSLFDPPQIGRLMAGIGAIWPLESGCEVTMEGNPESLTQGRLAGYGEAGITRMSVGVQALDEGRLRQLQRPHDRAQALQGLGWLAQAGFSSWSADFIFATPGHTVAGWLEELAEVLAFAPPHLSCYGLTVEPGTPFFQRQQGGEALVADEERQLALLEATYERLTAAGLPSYEISNFARAGHGCRHNVNYWRFGDYLGVGVAAHGKWSDADGVVWRSANLADAARYMACVEAGRSPWVRDQRLTPQEAGNEALVMGLRMGEGMSKATYQWVRGVSLQQSVGDGLAWFERQGMLAQSATHVWLTPRGLRLADGVMAELMEVEP
ncbi:coproporphyrinogen III oxidase, anaerobic [Magnetococcus marinus MC-1]|uniref:Heme chaperone HemW n=1 Tax=Magnetococcus marinus (strain ATCC BAA-1437 / JCM 17883 / MC-1) TaxID=156889 RepID=A0L3N8_MAGMM|nr:radical SAM family heme chaperone HemW [Magnetococcus marinus]ABK42581.1 coproporphyrinogen III oxidase, anaerobic [Magnetococcus marinus MC-1]